MKIVKVLVIAALVYVGIVVVFEALLGYFQPRPEQTIVITTFDEDGSAHDRVVSALDSGDTLYVAVNHWPRAWYRRVLDEPDVRVTRDGETRAYRAVPVSGEEYARVDAEHALPVLFRFLTGFPPRKILRLEPRTEPAPAAGAQGSAPSAGGGSTTTGTGR